MNVILLNLFFSIFKFYFFLIKIISVNKKIDNNYKI